MAITKILNINSTDEGNPAEHLKNALEYIQNPDKTEKCQLVGGINCLPEMAYNQMMDTKQTYGKSGKRQAYHVIISFPPEETVTPDQARFVAEGFIKDILKNEYEVVYGIHTDKEHTHVHIIWNSVSLVTGKEYCVSKTELEEESATGDKQVLQRTWIRNNAGGVCKESCEHG